MDHILAQEMEDHQGCTAEHQQRQGLLMSDPAESVSTEFRAARWACSSLLAQSLIACTSEGPAPRRVADHAANLAVRPQIPERESPAMRESC